MSCSIYIIKSTLLIMLLDFFLFTYFFHPLHLSCTECDVLKLAIIMFIFVSYHIIKVIYVLCVYLQYCVGFSVTAK